MTISVWRYSHLALAVSSFLFILLAALTGIILSFKPLIEKSKPYKAEKFDQITVAGLIPVLQQSYTDISEVRVDHHGFVIVNGTDSLDQSGSFYIDPVSGRKLGIVEKESAFFEWVTAFHRSLFLHEWGRFFVGLTAFLLLMITLSGIVLIIQRQRSLKRFFTRIVKDHVHQYYHVVLGRLMFIPMILISLSGTYLSLQRFDILKTKPLTSGVDPDTLKTGPQLPLKDFDVFKQTRLNEIEVIEFPFSDDVEDFFTLKLHDQEIVVNQLTGDVLSTQVYDKVTWWAKLSLSVHTGQDSAIWAIILGLASVNILYFIWSGFAMTLKRRSGRIKNKYKAAEAEIILLAGSENGSTFRYAAAIQEQLLKAGKISHLTELNHYTVFPKAKQLLVLTATYGLGDAPTNASRFLSLLEKYPQPAPLQFAVLAFGSCAYPDFCKFGFDVHNALSRQEWAVPLIELHTINDRSPDEVQQWLTRWSAHLHTDITLPASLAAAKPGKRQRFEVIAKDAPVEPGQSFLIRLRPLKGYTFHSGDLITIYPANDHRERQYSIGKIGKTIQLSVKRHENGLGSGFLNALSVGQILPAKLVANPHFHFPENAGRVIMVSNGTGIAPFLGMIDQYGKTHAIQLYAGFRSQASFAAYEKAIHTEGCLRVTVNLAFSREGERQYVKDLLARDKDLVLEDLKHGGVIMICGSLQMQQDVLYWLETCLQDNDKALSDYQSQGQILMDCY